MAKYARGKKSYAISDRGGQRVRYTQLKTTWDGLRVAPDEWEPKHPQLTPAKNIIDAEQLFKPRSTGQDREDVVIYLAFSYDPFIPPQQRPAIGCPGHGGVGLIDKIDLELHPEPSGQAGTGAVGNEVIELTIAEAGVAGSGAAAGASYESYLQYAITVQSTAAGNRYYVDSVLQQQLYLQEGQTYRLDQSDSSNSGHPIRFSTTSNGTHAGGSQYTTGVTTNGTPGSSGAYTQITVASGAPTLYYYCTNHNYMGGTSKTPAAGTITLTTTVVGGNPSNHPYHNVGSSNKYAIDGSTATSDVTLLLTEGTTFRFDQSDSSNSGHPLRFSTTANGTHGGGSEYTTGVTTSGTPGSSGAYTEITVAADAPTLYYYCTNHSSMGWTAKTPALTTSGSGITVELSENATGLAGDGEVGQESIVGNPPISAGAAGTGAVGAEVPEVSVLEAGVAGTGAIGDATDIEIQNAVAWGQGTWGQLTWGN